MRKHHLPSCSLWLFWIVVAVLYAAVFTTIDFCDNPFSGLRGFATLFAQAMVVAVSAAGVIGVMSLHRVVFAITFPVLVVLSSVLGYFHLTLGVALSAANIELMMVNNVSIWLTLVSGLLVLVILLSLVLSGLIVAYRWKYVKVGSPWIFLVVNLLIVCTPVLFVHRFFDAVSHRMPYCFYYAFKDYLNNRKEISKERNSFVDVDVTAGSELPDVILLLGESLRADHLSINGYHRPTTPNLEKDSSVVAYPHIHTHQSATHQNIPQILTRADTIYEDRAYSEESFIPLFKKAGYNSYWVSNQDKNSTYAYFMSETDSTVLISPGWTTHNFMAVHDRDMLPMIERFLKKPASAPHLLIVHTMGSHWVYNLSYPADFAVYKPEVDSRILSELSIEQLNNSYDNTILATDDFVANVISLLRDRNAILIYISDHGENLGEDGLYLHNQHSQYVFNPACFFWYSDKYKELYPDKVANLKSNAPFHRNNDIIFHSILDAADLKTEVLDTHLSVFSSGYAH
ncbi:MAG: phosphoethanolamine transferase [Duncaniella sp.]|nr:phosphoethanolamine transferase [Duncaniella sp.]